MMNRLQAEKWVAVLTEVLTGKELIAAESTPLGLRIRQHEVFKSAYFVEHDSGDCVVALADSYGAMTGAEKWTIDPDRRSVSAETTNGYGEIVRFAWAIVSPSPELSEQAWQDLREAQRRLWQ